MRFVKKIGFTDWESRQLCDGAFVVVDQSAKPLSALDRQVGVRRWRFSDGSIADGLVRSFSVVVLVDVFAQDQLRSLKECIGEEAPDVHRGLA